MNFSARPRSIWILCKENKMPKLDILSELHASTKRNYLERVVEGDKAACAERARKFDRDYWDGDRKHGYGGYRYDGRWRGAAEKLVDHYGLKAGDSVLDVGCGKAHLLYEMTQVRPDICVRGLDISAYAIEHAKEEVRPFLDRSRAEKMPYPDGSFDLVISLNTLHNLYVYDLESAIREIQRVGKARRYVVVESYGNEREKANLLHWQLTCECFFSVGEWEWVFKRFGYRGDYSFVFFR